MDIIPNGTGGELGQNFVGIARWDNITWLKYKILALGNYAFRRYRYLKIYIINPCCY